MAQETDPVLSIATANLEPYTIHGENSIDGIYYQLVERAADQAGIQLTWHRLPLKRAQFRVANGSIDAILPVVKSTERLEWFEYPDKPLDSFDISLFGKQAMIEQFDGDFTSIADSVIGTLLGGRLHPIFENAREQKSIAVAELRDALALIRSYQYGRIDGFVRPEVMGNWLMLKHGVDHETYSSKSFATSDVYLALSKKSPHRESWLLLNEQINSLIERDAISEIKTSFLNSTAQNQIPNHQSY